MRESSHILNYINFILLIMCNLVFCIIVLKKWKGRFLDILLPIIYPIICTFAVVYTNKLVLGANEPATYIILFITSLVTLIILLRISLEEAMFLGVFQVFHLIFAKSISAGTFSIILEKNMFQLLQVEQYAQLIMTVSYILIGIIFVIYFLFINKKELKSFFLCKGQVSYIMIIHVLITIYMLFKSYNFYYNLDLIWFSVEQVYTAIIIYVIYILIIRFSMRISYLIQNPIRHKNQNTKILSQISGRLNYKKAYEFIENYKLSAQNINQFIEKQPNDNIKNEIDILNKKLENINTNIEEISEIEIINGLFYELQNDCDFKDIEISGEYFFPQNIKIEDKELHEILSCLLKNSFESNCKILDGNTKFISIDTIIENKKFIIKMSNPYNKKPKMNNGYLESTKLNLELEGLGIGYVEEVIEKNKGKLKFKIDNKSKLFYVEITLKMK